MFCYETTFGKDKNEFFLSGKDPKRKHKNILMRAALVDIINTEKILDFNDAAELLTNILKFWTFNSLKKWNWYGVWSTWVK